MSSVTFAIVSCAFRASGPSGCSTRGFSDCFQHDAPELVQKPPDALDPGVVPLHVLVGRTEEEREGAAPASAP
jgi:hypothetical protein